MADRDRYLNVRVTEEEAAMAHALAEREGFSVSDYVRQFIRRAHAETFGEKKPKRAKR